MRYTVFTDTHFGSKYCDDGTLANQIQNSNPANTILLGDIIDLACCPKDQLESLLKMYHRWKEKFGLNYISGNHERDWHLDKNQSVIIKGVYFCHGDLLSNPEKWLKYRQKPQGAGLLKRIWVDIAEDFDWIKEKRPIPRTLINAAVEKAKFSHCHTVVCGHFHPHARMELLVDGIKIILLPKGKNFVEVPDGQ